MATTSALTPVERTPASLEKPNYRVFEVAVTRVRRVSPCFVRITFRGPDLDTFGPAGCDQRVKVVLPRAGRGVRELEYVGHPSADEVIGQVASEIVEGAEGVRAVAVMHRLGLLRVGDLALACAVAAEHRKQAFDACSELVDEVKRRLPIWKRQVFDDGTEEWVNCP